MSKSYIAAIEDGIVARQRLKLTPEQIRDFASALMALEQLEDMKNQPFKSRVRIEFTSSRPSEHDPLGQAHQWLDLTIDESVIMAEINRRIAAIRARLEASGLEIVR